MDEHSLHHDDFYAWTREQADVLRGLRGRPDLPNDLDVENVIEEIESVGSEVRGSVESFIRLILLHLLKVAGSRSDQPLPHWRSEIAGFHADIAGRYSRSMRQAIDLDRVWLRALNQARLAVEEHGDTLPRTVSKACPVPIEDFAAEEFPSDEALERVAATLTGNRADAT